MLENYSWYKNEANVHIFWLCFGIVFII